MNRVHFSSKDREWETPESIFNPLRDKHNIVLDVCATDKNKKCDKFLDKDIDGLRQDWTVLSKELGGACWMNPPYGKTVEQWIRKAYEESQKGATIVALLPARTDTSWFHKYIYTGLFNVTFIKGRIKFVGAEASAPFPSMIVIFKQKQKKSIWKKLWS